jgi:hypothetical protein
LRLRTDVAAQGSNAWAVSGRARIGAARSASLTAGLYTRTASDPIVTRFLFEDAGGFAYLYQPGTSVFGQGDLPLGRFVRIFGGAHVDASARELLGATAGLELRDRCDCVGFRVQGSQRQGRDGVDVWLEIDLHPR